MQAATCDLSIHIVEPRTIICYDFKPFSMKVLASCLPSHT